MKLDYQRLKTLFLANLYISTFTFGGGFVITTFMRKKFVQELAWIKDDEMLELVAIAQSSPGSIAVNAAILVGYHIQGVMGVIVSVIATIIPPFVIMYIIYGFYALFASNIYIALLLQGIQIAVTAIIFDTVFDLSVKLLKTKNLFYYALLIATLILSLGFKMDAVLIIVISLVLGLLYSIWQSLAIRM